MKRIFILIIIQLCTSLCTMAQQQERWKFNPEEFRAKLEEFITREAGFTTAEAQAFYPVFHKMKEEQRNLAERNLHAEENPHG